MIRQHPKTGCVVTAKRLSKDVYRVKFPSGAKDVMTKRELDLICPETVVYGADYPPPKSVIVLEGVH